MSSEKVIVRADHPDLQILAAKLYGLRLSMKERRAEEQLTLEKIKELAPEFLADGVDGIRVGDLRLLRSIGKRRTVQAERLLQRGVPADVVAACTRESEYESWKVEVAEEGAGE